MTIDGQDVERYEKGEEQVVVPTSYSMDGFPRYEAAHVAVLKQTRLHAAPKERENNKANMY